MEEKLFMKNEKYGTNIGFLYFFLTNIYFLHLIFSCLFYFGNDFDYLFTKKTLNLFKLQNNNSWLNYRGTHTTVK